jgi:enamine deaminase RidA (YjgF/YER057c/UK114 family)
MFRLGDAVVARNICADASTTDLERASEEAFRKLERNLEMLGGTAANVGRVTAYIEDPGTHREVLYGPWTRWFPREDDRPAFKVLDATPPNGAVIGLDAVICLGQTRTRFDISNVDARDPTVRIGDWVFTSRLHGTTPRDGSIVEGLAERCQQAIANGIDLVQRAGGSAEDVVQVCGFGNNLDYVAELSHAIDAAFSARKPSVHVGTTYVRPQVEVMAEFTACIGWRNETNRTPLFREVWPEHGASNIPTGFQLGQLVVNINRLAE